jgi:hypothetical protein
MGVVPKSGEASKRVVREATTDVLLKLGLYGIQVKIAIKDAVPPMVEFIDQTVEAAPQVQPEEAKKAEAPQKEPKTPKPKAEKAPKAGKAPKVEKVEKVEKVAEPEEPVTPEAAEPPVTTEKVDQIAQSESKVA